MREHEIQKFFSDPDLVYLIELIKDSDNPFNATSKYENQHSDILTWLFNAKESHGQGDLIIKDFLMHIHARCEKGVKGKGGVRDFSKIWNPGRISITNFSSAITLREYNIAQTGNDRIDLLIIDPINKFIIGVENKSGSKHNTDQLGRYHDGIQSIKNKILFREYKVAYVALDSQYSADTDDVAQNGVQPEHERWLRMDYSWLKHSARRAEKLGGSDRHSAAFIKSYCQQQGVYDVSEASSEEINIITRISAKHENVIKELSSLKKSKVTFMLERWNNESIDFGSATGQLSIFYMQNRKLCDRLIETSGLQLIDFKIRQKFNLTNENIDRYRSYIAYRTEGADALETEDDFWPVFISVRQKSEKFSVRVIARPSFSTNTDLCTKIFRRVAKDKYNRTEDNNYSIDEAIDKFSELEKLIREVLATT